MKRMVQWIKGMSVTVQLILIVTAVVLPMNVISLTYASHVRKSYIDRSVEADADIVETCLDHLDQRMKSADDFMNRDLITNVYIARMSRAESTDEIGISTYLYWQELNERVKSFMEADAYFFYQQKVDCGDLALATDGEFPYGTKATLQSNIRETVTEGDYSRGWFLKEIDGLKWLLHIFQMGNSSYYYGSAICLDSVEKEIEENFRHEETGLLIFEEEQTEREDLVPVQSGDLPFHVYLVPATSQIYREIPVTMNLGFTLVLVYFLAVPLIIWLVRVILLRPLRDVNQAMEQLENGRQDYRITVQEPNRETQKLAVRFNSMAEQIGSLKIQVYEKELERRDIEAVNLRLQVNPHFILNCLNIIFSLARSGKPENMAVIRVFTKHLANYLRFSLWQDRDKVALGDELKCVENYIEIQKIRFPDKFHFLENVEEDLFSMQIPSLLILNFVENCIKYALNMDGTIDIYVNVRREDDQLYLSVCDTGVGMPPETLEILREGKILENSTGKHIGIWNCRRRIAMIYGDQAYFQISSTLGEGTQIFIRIPAEEDHDTVDR